MFRATWPSFPCLWCAPYENVGAILVIDPCLGEGQWTREAMRWPGAQPTSWLWGNPFESQPCLKGQHLSHGFREIIMFLGGNRHGRRGKVTHLAAHHQWHSHFGDQVLSLVHLAIVSARVSVRAQLLRLWFKSVSEASPASRPFPHHLAHHALQSVQSWRLRSGA